MSHEPYPAYRASGLRWLGQIPEGWDVQPLKLLAKAELSNVDKLTVEGQPPVRLCNYVDVYKNERIVPTLQFMTATASVDQIFRLTLKQGDVLITKDSEMPDDIGIPALVNEDMDGVVCGYHLALLRPDCERAVGGYIQRALQSAYAKAEFYCSALGLTRYGLSKYDIESLKLPVPPLAEQVKIVAALDRETARIDSLIAKKAEFIDLLAKKRQALISHAVTSGLSAKVQTRNSGIGWLGDVPANWGVVPSTWLFVESKERARPDDEHLSATQKYGVIPLAEYERLEARQVTHAVKNLDQRKHVEVNHFVISMRSFEGGIERVKARGCVRSSYVVLQAEEGAEVGYFSYLFKSSAYIQGLQATATYIRDGQDLSYSNFRQVKLPLPPLDEQRHIAAFLDRSIRRLDALSAMTQKSIELLRQRRSALITAAVTGQIDLRESA